MLSTSTTFPATCRASAAPRSRPKPGSDPRSWNPGGVLLPQLMESRTLKKNSWLKSWGSKQQKKCNTPRTLSLLFFFVMGSRGSSWFLVRISGHTAVLQTPGKGGHATGRIMAMAISIQSRHAIRLTMTTAEETTPSRVWLSARRWDTLQWLKYLSRIFVMWFKLIACHTSSGVSYKYTIRGEVLCKKQLWKLANLTLFFSGETMFSPLSLQSMLLTKLRSNKFGARAEANKERRKILMWFGGVCQKSVIL